MIKGLELSKKYFEEIYLPVIKSEFPEVFEKMAAGLAGEGSECFGFHDEISQCFMIDKRIMIKRNFI